MSQKLSDTILEFNGSDARTVLQGQTTRNFVDAAVGSVLEGAFCDLKGRIIADFCAVIVRDNRILMRTDTEVAAGLTSHLQKYLMFSKTTLRSSSMSVWACESSSLTDSDIISESTITVKQRGNIAEIWAKESSVPENLITPQAYSIHRIVNGDARLVDATIGKYLPQDLNYDLNGRVDFDKGCYTGQEIIARLHYRGEPKRRLHLLSVPTHVGIAAGEKVLNAQGKPIGSVVEAVVSGDVSLCLCEATLDIKSQAPYILGEAAVSSHLQQF